MEAVAKALCAERNYTFLGGAGVGSFKETFAASTESGNLLALKILKVGCLTERTEREIAAMKKCNHPNIIALLEISSILYDGQRYDYFVEEYLSGGSLEDRLKIRLATRDEVLDIGSALLKALIHHSEHDLVHRDYKPANIMFKSPTAEAQLGDFGIVRDLQKEGLTKSFLAMGPGSPYFAAPEQLNNEKSQISWRTDQFSLAVTLSLAAFGVHPYQEEVGSPASQIVSSVATRKGPSLLFKALAEANQLGLLARMAKPWPVQRVRTPRELLNLWIKQKE